MCTAQTSRAAGPKANYPSTDDGLVSPRIGQPMPLPHAGLGLHHFNDEYERHRHLAHCLNELEVAAAASDLIGAGFWLGQIDKITAAKVPA